MRRLFIAFMDNAIPAAGYAFGACLVIGLALMLLDGTEITVNFDFVLSQSND
jgi:hypothetical protein